jgi:hypothetical protein
MATRTPKGVASRIATDKKIKATPTEPGAWALPCDPSASAATTVRRLTVATSPARTAAIQVPTLSFCP